MVSVGDRRCFLLQIAHILIVEINIDERTELAFIGIKMSAQVGMLGNQSAQGFTDGRAADFNRRLLTGILPQRRRNVDLRHA